MAVVLLLACVWAAVLVPPLVQAHMARREAFLVSFGQPQPPDVSPPAGADTLRERSQRIRCRRRIAGGLVVAMAVTLVVGLLPTFRVFLVVHLFVVDSFLGYVAALAHLAERARRAGAEVHDGAAEPADRPAGSDRRLRPRPTGIPRPPILPELGPVAPAR